MISAEMKQIILSPPALIAKVYTDHLQICLQGSKNLRRLRIPAAFLQTLRQAITAIAVLIPALIRSSPLDTNLTKQ